jgi:hypothetical protein
VPKRLKLHTPDGRLTEFDPTGLQYEENGRATGMTPNAKSIVRDQAGLPHGVKETVAEIDALMDQL